MPNVKVVAGNRGKFVLRWVDSSGVTHQRTVDIPSKPSNRKKAYKLASELEAELSGDLPPNISIPKRTRAVDVLPDSTPHSTLDGEWESYKQHFKDTHLSGLSAGYQKTMIPIIDRFKSFANPENVKDVTASKVRLWIASLRVGKKAVADTTIKSYWGHLSAFLSIAVDDGILDSVPRVRLPKVGKRMKGRAFTLEEFERIKMAVDSEKRRRPDEWKWSLDGLWASGLRISEAYRITWHPSDFYVDMDQKHPSYVILGDQKNKKHQRLPIVPEFAQMLKDVPKRKRHGRIFSFPSQKENEQLSFTQAKRVIATLGRKANVITTGSKTATAHDFRRSFGTRLAMKVMPQVLQKLMRHSDINTTMTFYAHLDSDLIIESLYAGDQTGDQNSDLNRHAKEGKGT